MRSRPTTPALIRLGRGAKDAAARAATMLNPVLPAWPVRPLPAPVVGVCVYRARHAGNVRRILTQLPSRTEVRLHALDEVVPALAGLTLSAGPGERTQLLQRLVDAREVPDGAWVVLFDDDAVFVRPGRSRFLDYAAEGGLDVAGPVIAYGSPASHVHTRPRPLRTARRVALVEIGPVVAFSPAARAWLLPLPAGAGMGWGLDVEWTRAAARHDLTLGLVDATPIRHLGEIAAAYDDARERVRLEKALQEAGIASMTELTIDLGRPWRPWERRAPWVVVER